MLVGQFKRKIIIQAVQLTVGILVSQKLTYNCMRYALLEKAFGPRSLTHQDKSKIRAWHVLTVFNGI